MNALSYGWWVGRVYRYNDADHVVLQEATEGENRARVTSAVITGMFIAGDDFSADGSGEGKLRAQKYLVNREVNALATGESFRPVEGNGARSENRFVRLETGGGLHYAVFNYSDGPAVETIPLERLGLDPSGEFTARELWSGAQVDPKSAFTLPAKDVAIFKISPR
jgi:alpha-galactosidase